MSAVEPISQALAIAQPDAAPASISATGSAKSFGAIMMDRINEANSKMVNADALVAQFAVDDSVPVHEVTIALEQAHLSLELMMQIRARVVDAYQEFMRMQL